MYGLLEQDKIFGWDTSIWKSEIWGCKKKNQNIEKIAFKVVLSNAFY